MNPDSGETPRTRLKRLPKRGSHNRKILYDILDHALMCHVGFIYEGKPVVTPTLFWRDGDAIYWHGSTASRMLRAAENSEVCVTVSILDGLVLARSAFHHSANYRSAMIFGRATPVEANEDKLRSLEVMMETIAPGRFEVLRPVLDRELRATTILTLPLNEFSTKCRTGDVTDDPSDLDWPVWAGVVPFKLQIMAPEPTQNLTGDYDAPRTTRPTTP